MSSSQLRLSARATLTLCIATALVSISCTKSRLYGREGSAAEPDRVALSGRVCTEDPSLADFQTRVVVVADVAAGPLFAAYDPGGSRLMQLQSFIMAATFANDTEFAIVSYAGRSRKLAPMVGNFTDSPTELQAAVATLALPQPCVAGSLCRRPLEGLRTARTLIEGDLAETAAGNRVLRQYVVLMLVAGPPAPDVHSTDCCSPDDAACLGPSGEPCLVDMDCGAGYICQGPMSMRVCTGAPSATCEATLELAAATEMREAIADLGAIGVKIHIVHLAAEAPPINDALQTVLEPVAFAGAGSYQRFDAVGGLTDRELDVLGTLSPLRVKTLIAANLNAKPTPGGPVVDSDADGLSDEEEDNLGTDPITRDTDGDKISDFVETLTGFDPLVTDMPAVCEMIVPGIDQDLDGLTDCDEGLLATDPTLVDTDGDGLPDFLEVIGLVDYLAADGGSDTDGDGVSNADEIASRTDPRTTDVRSHLAFGYRYETQDEGIVTELFADPLIMLTGVEVVGINPGVSPGLGAIFYDVGAGTLAWQDASDMVPGPAVTITGDGEYDLPSSSWAPIQGDAGRLIRVLVRRIDLPPSTTNERLRIIPQTHQCMQFTIRNVRLMPTRDLEDGEGPGRNSIVLFFAESAENRFTFPGPFRLAEVNIRFIPPGTRIPGSPVIQLDDTSFFRPFVP